METAFSKFLRFLFWPIIVIAAINIENWASQNGYSTMLTSRVDPESGFGIFLQLLKEPLMTHIAAFFAGGAILMWIAHWTERLEYRHGGPPRWIVVSKLAVARDALGKERKSYMGTLVSKIVQDANKALAYFELPAIDESQLGNDSIREEYHAYFHAIVPLLEKRNDAIAAKIAGKYQQEFTRLIAEPR